MSTISSSTTSTTAYKVTADTTGTLVIQTGATPTTAVTVDASQNVGIGTSSPNKKLEVLGAGEIIRATSNNAAADQLISVKNNSGTADCSTNIFFADRYAASSYASSYIRGTTSGISALIFATGGTNFTNIYDAGAPVEQARITAAGLFQFNSGYGSVATAYGCRAWVNFNGTTASPSTIRGSGNVTSVTKNGTGDYTVNFTTAMPDANYALSGSAGWGAASAPSTQYALSLADTTAPTASAVRVNITLSNGSKADPNYVYTAIHR